MDFQGFEGNGNRIIGSSHSTVVFETSFMGGRFALKQFHREGFEEMFANEAVIQAGLRHANTAHLVACLQKASTNIGLVMEFMDQDLRSFIQSDNYASFSLLDRLDLILQIANGMHYLHELGIMHRDLKSLNILVNHSRSLGGTCSRRAKIADFGTAKVKNHSSLFTTKPVGTRIWCAPEIIDGEVEKKYTRKADVWSFAIVCCEILMGLPPDQLFPEVNTREDFCKLLKKGKRPDLHSVCPTGIAHYIARCWDGNALERPAFKQICRVFRVFKTCILLQETQLLDIPLQDDILIRHEEHLRVQTIEAGMYEGKFYHPVFDITPEMQTLLWLHKNDGKENLSRRCTDHNYYPLIFLRSGPVYIVDPQGNIHLRHPKIEPLPTASDSPSTLCSLILRGLVAFTVERLLRDR